MSEIQGVERAIQQAAEGIGKTGQIVRDIFAELEKFVNELEEAKKQEILKKIQEQIEKLSKVKENLNTVVEKISAKIDQLKGTGIGGKTNQALKVIEQQLDDLKNKLQMP